MIRRVSLDGEVYGTKFSFVLIADNQQIATDLNDVARYMLRKVGYKDEVMTGLLKVLNHLFFFWATLAIPAGPMIAGLISSDDPE